MSAIKTKKEPEFKITLMPLGPERLLKLVKEKGLVEGLSERELKNPEGAGFDLRVSKIFKIKGDAFLGIDERRTLEVELVASFDEEKRMIYTIKPDEFVLMQTVESVNMPDNLTAHNFPRTTLFRSGLQLLATQVAPGYQGQLIFGLKNVGPSPVAIEMGARLTHIQFFKVSGGGTKYRGQWQGGRVTTGKLVERQV